MQLHVKTRILAFVHKIPDSTEKVAFAGKKQTEKGNIYLSKVSPQMIGKALFLCRNYGLLYKQNLANALETCLHLIDRN